MYFTFACSMIFVPASIRTFSFASESFQKPSSTSFGTSCADAAVTIVISAKEMDFKLQPYFKFITQARVFCILIWWLCWSMDSFFNIKIFLFMNRL